MIQVSNHGRAWTFHKEGQPEIQRPPEGPATAHLVRSVLSSLAAPVPESRVYRWDLVLDKPTLKRGGAVRLRTATGRQVTDINGTTHEILAYSGLRMDEMSTATVVALWTTTPAAWASSSEETPRVVAVKKWPGGALRSAVVLWTAADRYVKRRPPMYGRKQPVPAWLAQFWMVSDAS